jgi:hypothetical protein
MVAMWAGEVWGRRARSAVELTGSGLERTVRDRASDGAEMWSGDGRGGGEKSRRFAGFRG